MTLPVVFANLAGPIPLSDLDLNFSAIVGASGASLIGFTQSGTGAVARTVQDKLSDAVSVMDFMTTAQIADVKSGTASIDATASIQAAAASLTSGGTLLFPQGTYLILSQITIPSDVTAIGYGATLNLSSSVAITGGALYITGANVAIEGISFDLGVTRCPTYNSYPTIENCAVYGFTATNLKIINCNFSNLYTVAIQYYTSTGLEVRGCSFTSPAQVQRLHLEHIWLLTCGGDLIVENNSFLNTVPSDASYGVCAIYASGIVGALYIRKNTANYCGRNNTGSHRLGVFDLYGNGVGVHVQDNTATNCLAQFMRVSSVAYGRINDNLISYASIATVGDTVISIESTIVFAGVGQTGCQDIQVIGNSLVNNSDATRPGITSTCYDFSVPATDIVISGNTFNGFHRPIVSSGPFRNLRIERNSIRGNNGGTIIVQYGATVITATNGVTEAQSSFEGLHVNDNEIDDAGSTNQNGIFFDMTKSPEYVGTVGLLEFTKNRVRSSVSANTSQGIAARNTTVANVTRLVVRENEVDGYAYCFYLRNHNEVTLEQNKGRNIATSLLLQSGNGSVNQSLNRSSAGPYAGRATLVAGSATVSTAEVQAIDDIILTNVASGGSAGFLKVGTIVAGTSFVITSSSGSDTSTVFWQIIH